jgi:hypothetical protein
VFESRRSRQLSDESAVGRENGCTVVGSPTRPNDSYRLQCLRRSPSKHQLAAGVAQFDLPESVPHIGDVGCFSGLGS